MLGEKYADTLDENEHKEKMLKKAKFLKINVIKQLGSLTTEGSCQI